MKKMIITAAVLVTGLGVVSYALLADNTDKKSSDLKTTQNPVPSEEKQQEPLATLQIETVTVTYDENGFTPKEVTIAKGSTVNFINNSEIPLWVASDPHPEHTDYPEFDTPVANNGRMPRPDEDFSFTFDKIGTWKYHSHTASSDVGTEEVHPGTIIVK